ncbi:MAG TPA: Lrp/AsnC family transcriptional regulator [Pseudorhodoferax sp.]|jgi:DNA-binding Lrp family transcriptional regulator|nr:Lrp/AsnC family transcriptional regulator [Pseudorhodoferax sp.]
MELDRTDLRLLELLQRDGRASVQSLSEEVHLSARATLNRVRKLERQGLIDGYRAVLNRRAVGPAIAFFAEIALKDQRQAASRRFEARMLATPEVVACYLLSGRYDYLVRIACADLAQYQRLTNGWLEDATLGIEKIVTNTELQTVKEFGGFPLA